MMLPADLVEEVFVVEEDEEDGLLEASEVGVADDVDADMVVCCCCCCRLVCTGRVDGIRAERDGTGDDVRSKSNKVT